MMTASEITIRKVDFWGDVQAIYRAWLLKEGDPLVVAARWRYETLSLPFVSFSKGDLLFECFPRHRHFNVFALCDGRAAPAGLNMAELAARYRRLQHKATLPKGFCALASFDCPLKGHYVNFTLPVDYHPNKAVLTWIDLALDLWVPVAGPPILLDEEEYATLNIARTHPALHAAVQKTLAEIWPHALAHTGLFHPQNFCPGNEWATANGSPKS
ncbi:MAG: DUF402 domain-containing protein [Chloroflexi bacterium]|nr:DUF402 domain-containing protein [Chloroflexota bacterium]